MIYRRRFEWFECPIDREDLAAEGDQPFAARVLVNPTFGEVREEQHIREQWAKGEASDEEYFTYLAPRIDDWRFQTVGEDGSPIDVQAPGKQPDNWQAIALLPPDTVSWLLSVIRVAHLPKGRAILRGELGITDTNTQTESQVAVSAEPPQDSPTPSVSDSPTTP